MLGMHGIKRRQHRRAGVRSADLRRRALRRPGDRQAGRRSRRTRRSSIWTSTAPRSASCGAPTSRSSVTCGILRKLCRVRSEHRGVAGAVPASRRRTPGDYDAPSTASLRARLSVAHFRSAPATTDPSPATSASTRCGSRSTAVSRPEQHLTSGGLGTMGFGLPPRLARSCASRRRRDRRLRRRLDHDEHPGAGHDQALQLCR